MSARGALTLFHVRGIRIGVDYSWFFVLLLVIIWLSSFYRELTGSTQDDLEPYALAAASAFLFFGSILLHELGHAVVALRNGIGISEITLWMFGGIARMERDTDSAAKEFKIAVAGPLVTLAIAIACGVGGFLVAGDEFAEAMVVDEGAETSGVLAMVAWLCSINVLILLFNLIPAFPLDGGRIVRAIAWWRTGNRTSATRFATRLGRGFGMSFIALGAYLMIAFDVFTGIWLLVIGFILSSSARSTQIQNEVTSRIEHLRVADVMDAEPVAIPQEASVETALDEYFLRYRWPWFPVIDRAERFIGLLQRAAADGVPELQRASARVLEVAESDTAGSLAVQVDAPLESLLTNSALRRLGGIAAVDADGRLRGVITLEQVGRALRDAVTAPQPDPLLPP